MAMVRDARMRLQSRDLFPRNMSPHPVSSEASDLVACLAMSRRTSTFCLSRLSGPSHQNRQVGEFGAGLPRCIPTQRKPKSAILTSELHQSSPQIAGGFCD